MYILFYSAVASHRYTSKLNAQGGTDVYAIVLNWPADDLLSLAAPTPLQQTHINMLGYSLPLAWKPRSKEGIDISFPQISPLKLPSEHAWVLKLQNLGRRTSSNTDSSNEGH